MSDSEKKIEAPKRAIPKFTSFKAPAPPPATDAPNKRAPEDEKTKGTQREHGHRRRHHRSSSRSCENRHKREHRERDKSDGEHRRRSRRDGSRERSHRYRDHERRKDDNRRYRSKPRDTKSVIARTPAQRSPSPESGDILQKQFFVDTKGDENNLVFGTIHKYSIPDYLRSGAGRIVGLPTNLRIDRGKGDGKGIVLSSEGAGREEVSVKSMRQLFANLDSKDVKRLRVKKEKTGLDEALSRGLDFVPLSIASKKRKSRDVEASDDSENELDHYRSIEGLKKPSAAPDDPDLAYASDSQSEQDYVAGEWGDRKRMVQFIRKVESSPNDIDAWLAYVNHHDRIISSTGRRKTAAEKRSTAEVKLDILEKALDKNSGNEVLLLKYMDVAQEIWEPQKVLSRWKRILEENPTLVSLWTKYINFRQTDFLSFKYPECLDCFRECLAVLKTAALKSSVQSSSREALDGVILYVFTRTILLMNQAGYRENAIAALQAMLELNVFAPANTIPPTSQQELETLLGHLEKFWDSEVPRIGEDNALGWASFVAAGEIGDSPDALKDDFQPLPLNPEDPFGSWADAEVEWSKKTGMPARTIDEVEEDDPYRVVLFADIKDFLFYFSSENVRKRTAETFLTLKGLPQLDLWSSNSEAVADSFLCHGLATLRVESSETWFWPKKERKWDIPAIIWEGMEPEKKATMGDYPFEFKLRNFPVGYEGVFCKAPIWLDGNEHFRLSGTDNTAFVRNALKSLVEKVGDESLALYYLAWEWANAPNGIKKVAKALLKRFKTSLQLWSAYGQVEWHDSGIDAGRKIFTLAIAMSKELSENARRDAVFLWHAWVWEELLSKNTQTALQLVLTIGNGKPYEGPPITSDNVSQLLLLKARMYLEDLQQSMLSIRLEEHAAVFNDLRAVLEYLVSGNNIDFAIPIYEEFVAELKRRSLIGPSSRIYEVSLLRKARLIYLHSMTAKPFKPAALRSVLETALETFPQNTAFLSMYAWNEGRTKIENRVRNVVRNFVLKEGRETVAGWLFAVWAEMRMSQHFSSHAVRSLFERAVSCDRIQASPQLWMMFVEFELQCKEYNRAKETLFRGIRNCPWSKDMMMMALTKLRSTLGFEDFRKLLSIISTEKELRVHDVTELEDMMEELGENGALGSGDFIALPDDDSTDEEMVDQY
ncbi:NRDE-2, necessary for RNA interference-domain-containing protein [Sphaerosporella brunnea]|uniref:NRDE-2, necessary for RNA interference-domain-containing protein n=1 Tax=Sphaerosporella brunnea TaxID=1250544 RepID=A0A5J5EDB8_9PEZI|nr:NRDE-2, necessary for RNA interference-domain-containing protein [Sphaerosporella brunnea]